MTLKINDFFSLDKQLIYSSQNLKEGMPGLNLKIQAGVNFEQQDIQILLCYWKNLLIDSNLDKLIETTNQLLKAVNANNLPMVYHIIFQYTEELQDGRDKMATLKISKPITIPGAVVRATVRSDERYQPFFRQNQGTQQGTLPKKMPTPVAQQTEKITIGFHVAKP